MFTPRVGTKWRFIRLWRIPTLGTEAKVQKRTYFTGELSAIFTPRAPLNSSGLFNWGILVRRTCGGFHWGAALCLFAMSYELSAICCPHRRNVRGAFLRLFV